MNFLFPFFTKLLTPVSKILKASKKRKNIDKYAYLSPLKEIRENEYNLNIPRYVDTFEEEEVVDIHKTQREIKDLEKELSKTRTEMSKRLKEFGV